MFSLLVSALSLFFSQIGVTLTILLGLLYYCITKDHDYFEKRNIQFTKPDFLFGNQKQVLTRKVTAYESYDEVYKKHTDVGIVGFFEFLKPSYMIKDPELMKKVMIKDFDSFVNHRTTVKPESDPVFAKNLFGSADETWKELRTVLSPAFTGSKMRFLYDLVRDCADRTVKKIEADMINGEYKYEAKTLYTKCTNDVIATSAFGIETNSLKDSNNVIYQNGLQFTDMNFKVALKFFMYISFPKIMNFFKVRIFDRKSGENLREILMDVVHQREKSGVHRPDMIQLLLQAKHKGRIDDIENENNGTQSTSKSKSIISDDDYFVAQCLVFYLAGFDTVSQLFTFLNYELALNPEVQKTLQAEIDKVHLESEGKQPTYEQIQKMKYLDMTIQEALRKWPPVIFVDRSCNQTVTLEDSAGHRVTLQPGDNIISPIYSIHRDPKFFPNPEKFDPLRFSEENKLPEHNIVFQPFGIGPRQCIGNRFALMEVKIFMYKLLLKFDIVKNSKTEIPLQMVKGEAQYKTVNGVHLTFKKRGK